MAVVARRYGIGTGQLYTCRKQLLRGAMAGFVPVELTRAEPLTTPSDPGRIELLRSGGYRKSVWQGTCVLLRVDLGGRRVLKKNIVPLSLKKNTYTKSSNTLKQTTISTN